MCSFETGCTHAEDRQLYESVKRKLDDDDWPDMSAYAHAKSEIVEAILARATAAFSNPPPPAVIEKPAPI